MKGGIAHRVSPQPQSVFPSSWLGASLFVRSRQAGRWHTCRHSQATGSGSGSHKAAKGAKAAYLADAAPSCPEPALRALGVHQPKAVAFAPTVQRHQSKRGTHLLWAAGQCGSGNRPRMAHRNAPQADAATGGARGIRAESVVPTAHLLLHVQLAGRQRVLHCASTLCCRCGGAHRGSCATGKQQAERAVRCDTQ